MLTSDFYYDLPEQLIAQTPIKDRASSRLLVFDKNKNIIEHKMFYDISNYLNPGDILVRNTTKVLPARLYGTREETGGVVEFLLLERVEGNKWKCLTKPFRRVKPDIPYVVSDELYITAIDDCDIDGGKIIELHYNGILEEVLDRVGEMPLPPYISTKLPKEDSNLYQTVYANQLGSAAAPTAGLHFTNELIESIKAKGVLVADVLLHVGLGTFRPVKTKTVEDHVMHSEYYKVTQETADLINTAKKAGGKVISVGTTSTRTLESVADENGIIHAGSGYTNIFITPGYKFKVVDSLITNFHLPESTLLMLVSALATREQMLNVYNTAVKEKYRFFSFGDAMLIK